MYSFSSIQISKGVTKVENGKKKITFQATPDYGEAFEVTFSIDKNQDAKEAVKEFSLNYLDNISNWEILKQ